MWLSIPRGLWLCIFPRYFDFKGPKSWEYYAWKKSAQLDCNMRPKECLDKKIEENTHPFFSTKWGSVFFNFFIRALLRPQILIWWRAILYHIILFCVANIEPFSDIKLFLISVFSGSWGQFGYIIPNFYLKLN